MKTLTWTGSCTFPFLNPFRLSIISFSFSALTDSLRGVFIVQPIPTYYLLTHRAGRSWYKRNDANGRVTATFAGSAMLFHEMVRSIRPEDFELRYRSTKNRFKFLGNGFMGFELEDGADLAWYVDT
jgi:hypothetical protein